MRPGWCAPCCYTLPTLQAAREYRGKFANIRKIQYCQNGLRWCTHSGTRRLPGEGRRIRSSEFHRRNAGDVVLARPARLGNALAGCLCRYGRLIDCHIERDTLAAGEKHHCAALKKPFPQPGETAGEGGQKDNDTLALAGRRRWRGSDTRLFRHHK